jgi:hypothetical protein
MEAKQMADDIIEFPAKGAKHNDDDRVGTDRDGDSSVVPLDVPSLVKGLILDGQKPATEEELESQQGEDLAEFDLEDIQSIKLGFLLNLIFTVCASEEIDVADVLAGLEAVRDRAND